MEMLLLILVSFIVFIGFLSWLSYIYRADLTEDERRTKLILCTIGILICIVFIGVFVSMFIGSNNI